MLLCPRWKDSVKCKAILLRTRAELRRSELHSLEIVAEGDNDLPAFPKLKSIWWSETERIQPCQLNVPHHTRSVWMRLTDRRP